MQKYAFAAAMAVASTSFVAPAAAQSVGHASYYGKELAGRKTASGERFNPGGLTAAHRSLPFGTQLKLTNRQNGRSVVVRVNDRGPFVRGRVIDVSFGAAQALGFAGRGVAQLLIEPLGGPRARGPAAAPQPARAAETPVDQSAPAVVSSVEPEDETLQNADRAIQNK